MAQSAAMGPPLSPRETRRSGRRSAPSISASASKSPDSDQPSREKTGSSRSAASSTNNRTKKPKQEDHEDLVDDRKHAGSTTSSNSNNGNNNRTKRKTKDKEGDKLSNHAGSVDAEIASVEGQLQDGQEEEEEQGITRCVCGSTEDDPDAGEFMVQCETCKVWQHGLCMGYISEDQVHDDDYYCELCKPQMHEDLLKRLARKPRQTSTASRHDPMAKDRISRSRSPSHLLKQPSKRRNTMNSRDAAFDESLKEIIEATAAEAAAVQETSMDDIVLPVPDIDNGKKKRKRSEDDSNAKKRTRSASTASDGQRGTAPPLDSPLNEKVVSAPKASAARNKRGGRKAATVEAAPAEAEEAFSASVKRPAHNSRAKSSGGPKRPPISQTISHGSGAATHEHGTRRNQPGAGSGQQGTSAADARAYRNSHAYAVSQQTLFTSWNLPDYLSHLEQMLPSDVPQPLEVRAGTTTTSGIRGESVEITMERGVKVKWPAKRMSVGDMNKRVRALVEWVGREQASALDRGRRREALEKVLKEQAAANQLEESTAADADVAMLVESNPSTSNPTNHRANMESNLMSESALAMSSQTMKTMEELMEELIGFQERFGPGAKTRERERRLAA